MPKIQLERAEEGVDAEEDAEPILLLLFGDSLLKLLEHFFFEVCQQSLESCVELVANQPRWGDDINKHAVVAGR